MSIKFWIAGPVTVLGLIAVVVAGWLTWGPLSSRWSSEATARNGVAIIEHAAQLREAQHLASGLAASVLSSTGENAALRARLKDAVSSALWHFEEMRTLTQGALHGPAVDQLGDELLRWSEAMDAVLAGQDSGRAGAAGLAAQTRHLSQLAGRASGEVMEDVVRSEDEHLAEHRRAGALAVSLLGGALLCMGWLALRFAHALTAAMQALPRDLGAFAEGRSPGRVTGEARQDELGEMARALRGVARSIQDLSQSRAEMERMAQTDPLTGLPNRRGLYEFLGRADIREGWADGRMLAVLHVDLDHFKTINDTHGHEAGDAVLRESTSRMAMAIRDSDLLARVGGDEFVIFAQGIESPTSLERLCERVIRQFEAPISFRDTNFSVTVSVGAVLGGRRARVLDPQRLLVNADMALCQAKAEGRNGFAIFNAAMARDVRRQHRHAAAIRLGIERGEFAVVFQPIIDVRTGRTTGLNLVPRWRHPDRGLLTPRDFVAVAEAHGLTEAFALPILRDALRDVADWRGAGIGVPRLHLGISRTMLLSPGIVDKFRWVLDETGCEPERLVLQVSEKHCVGRGVEVLFGNLQRLAGLGMDVLVDDFGAVDAALGTVARLRASRIKVAIGQTGGLLDGAGRGGRTSSDDLLRGFLQMGETLGVAVMAKRVETRADLQRLAALGYAEMEGAAVAPTMEAEATRQWLCRVSQTGPRLVAG